MKPTQWKSFFREIKKSLNRYLSILFIVALGVAFYTGVRSAEPDMRLSADKHYDTADFFDIRVLGSYGMTEGDIEEIKKISGVTSAEGAYTAEALWAAGDKEYVCTLYSMTKKANQPVVSEGRLPQAENECFLDESINMLRDEPFSIGDEITLSSGTEASLSDTLKRDTFTVVGMGTYPYYLSWDRGAANIGDGTADCFILLPEEVFAQDIYTAVYVTTDSLDSLNSFSDEYKEKLDKIKGRIEAIAGSRCEVRHQEVFEGANEQIEKAKQDLEEGKQKADTELTDALEQITEGEKQLADGKTQLLEKEQELLDAKKQIADGEQEIREKEKELSAAQREVDKQKDTLLDGELELMKGWSSYNSSLAQYNTTIQALDTLKPLQDYWNNLDLSQLEGEALEKALEAIEEVNKRVAELEASLDGAKEQLDSAYATLSEKQRELSDGKIKLSAAEAQLEFGRSQLETARSQLETSKLQVEDGETQIEEAKKTLEENEEKLNQAKQDYETGKAESEKQIADVQKQIEDGEKELNKLTMPEWYVLDRETVQTYVEYGMDAERIGAIGKVFPAIFFLVAALVSLTTMTRMVEDERTQIGTVKALGYERSSIAAKYLLYALSASLFGSLLGIFAGGKILPYVIMAAYGILYSNLPVMLIPIQWDLAFYASLIAIFCTVLATLIACYRELLSTPAALMRPAAPKQGKRVFLENISFLWKRLNFSWKATVRNLLRYKKRFFMTIFGIGGCMALLMVGFGLRDSIQEIVNKQYTTVWTYDASVNLDEDSVSDNPDFDQELNGFDGITESLYVYQTSLDVSGQDTATRSAYIFVPEDVEKAKDFVKLQERVGGKKLEMDGEGAVISEKLAKLLNLSVGDEIILKESETRQYSVTVAAITENYLYHYVFLTPEVYEQVYGKAPVFNQVFLKMGDTSAEKEESLGQQLLEKEEVTSVSFVSSLQSKVADMMSSMDLVIWVLIISAGLLAFVVLYNLNNINITERQREMATLKVLGFYDKEVADYVYRENVLLTLIGTLAGVFMGMALHQFVIRTCEIDMLMFGRSIRFLSYVFSIVLTFFFSAVVNFTMYYKLKKIDMIESLKSVE